MEENAMSRKVLWSHLAMLALGVALIVFTKTKESEWLERVGCFLIPVTILSFIWQKKSSRKSRP